MTSKKLIQILLKISPSIAFRGSFYYTSESLIVPEILLCLFPSSELFCWLDCKLDAIAGRLATMQNAVVIFQWEKFFKIIISTLGY